MEKHPQPKPKNPGGRPPGKKNRATIERELRARSGVDAALNGGLLPLDVMLAKLRGEALPDGKLPTDEQFQAAIAAAPYIHPRLASTDTTVKSDNVHRVVSEKPMTEDEWNAQHGVPANDTNATKAPDGRGVA